MMSFTYVIFHHNNCEYRPSRARDFVRPHQFFKGPTLFILRPIANADFICYFKPRFRDGFNRVVARKINDGVHLKREFDYVMEHNVVHKLHNYESQHPTQKSNELEVERLLRLNFKKLSTNTVMAALTSWKVCCRPGN